MTAFNIIVLTIISPVFAMEHMSRNIDFRSLEENASGSYKLKVK